jgi:hypothetical protein
MNLEIGTEAVQFPEKEYINGIFLAVLCTCSGEGEAGDDQPGEQELGQGPQCGPRPHGQGPRHGLQKSAAIVIFSQSFPLVCFFSGCLVFLMSFV